MVRFVSTVVLVLFALFQAPALASGVPSAPGWSTVKKNGAWWLVTPEGKQFYSKGVNIVTPFNETPLTQKLQEYCWSNFYPTMGDWRRCVGGQLLSWGFNTLGGWSDSSPDLGLALTVDLELGRNAKFHWFDPFHPSMEEQTLEMAREFTTPLKSNPNLIGYFSDNEVGWWNSPIFEWYLKAGWDNYTKKALWQTIYDQYGGDWEPAAARLGPPPVLCRVSKI